LILLETDHFWRVAKPKHVKSGVCSRIINFRKQYFYIDIGVESSPASAGAALLPWDPHPQPVEIYLRSHPV
jgi:hypothetical protein